MKDIDFDELDRAVSSLMGSVPKDKPASEPDDSNIVIIPESTIDTSRDELQDAETDNSASDTTPQVLDIEPVIVPNPESEQQIEPEPEKTLPPATVTRPVPSRGRFMDVVRPGRDMRKTPSSFTPRQGVTLQPSASMQQADSTASPEAPAPSQTEVDFAAQTAVMQELEDTASMATAPTESALDAPTFAVEENSFKETEEAAPLSSPFLADAKVEKRPLGRPAEASPFVDLSGELTEDTDQSDLESPVSVEEPSVSPHKDAQRPEEPLPAELDSKLLSIETEVETISHDSVPMQNETPEVAVPFASTSVESVSPTMDTPRTMASASIPQQYKLETGHSEEVPAGAIYDTQPLAHPAKAKPGWLWMLAIIIILILGAAGGAAVYYLGLL